MNHSKGYGMNCHVIFRSCARVYAVHDQPGRGRVGDSVTKAEIIQRCLWSLVKSMNNVGADLALTVVDDHSDEACLENMQAVLSRNRHPSTIVPLEDTGNGRSIKRCHEIGLVTDKALVYFVEDDYLHHPDAIVEMCLDHATFTRRLGREVALFPCDYPDNYVRPEFINAPSYLALGLRRHWRTVTNSTCTFFVTKQFISQHWEALDGLAHYGDPGISEDGTINRVWQRDVILMAPIPSLAVHLHDGTKSPHVDWRALWDASDWRE